MGISELLRKMGPITEPTHIRYFSKKTAAIDVSNWLYKGLYACAANETDSKSDLYLNYPLKMIALLRSFEIEPMVVFDGRQLKEKQKLLNTRKEQRETNIEKANYLLNVGNEDESKKYMKRALKIKSRMLNTLIDILKKLSVKVIVAPYEADTQIAYLVRKNYADFAISEDSDLLALGVQNIVMKLSPEGNCMNINFKKFKEAPMDNFTDPIVKEIKNMSYVNFLELCVMSGCDYLPSIKGFGIKTGLSLFNQHKKMEAVFHEMKFTEKFKNKIPENYLENAKKAVCMLFYQTVFDPKENKLVSMNIPTAEKDDDLERTYCKDHINKFVSQILCKINNKDENENGKEKENKQKGKKIFKNITEEINRELNIEGSDFPFTQEDLFKLFGENFPNSVSYCRGELDMKTFLLTKKIESEKTFNLYKEKYDRMFFFIKKENEKYLNEIKNSEKKKKDNEIDNINDEEIMKLISEEMKNTEKQKELDDGDQEYYDDNDDLVNYNENNFEHENNEYDNNNIDKVINNNKGNGISEENYNLLNKKRKQEYNNSNSYINKQNTEINLNSSNLNTPEKNNTYDNKIIPKSDSKTKNLLDLINKEKYSDMIKNSSSKNEEIKIIEIIDSPQK
jgi:exonuclease-1